MFRLISKKIFLISLVLLLTVGVSSCNSEQPRLIKAVTQFDTNQQRDDHIVLMRYDHRDLLRHKRDDTVLHGIRTEDNSLNACINCHIPKQHNGKILKHTDPEHFCATCHNYVAAKPDCFQCHIDHPVDDIDDIDDKAGTTSKLSHGEPGALHASVSEPDAFVDNKASINASTQEKQ